jgi:hypothetical protein
MYRNHKLLVVQTKDDGAFVKLGDYVEGEPHFDRHSHTFCMRAFCHYLHCLSMPKKDPYYHNFGTYSWIHMTKLGDRFHIPVTDRLNKRRPCVQKTIGRSGTLFCHFLLILVHSPCLPAPAGAASRAQQQQGAAARARVARGPGRPRGWPPRCFCTDGDGLRPRRSRTVDFAMRHHREQKRLSQRWWWLELGRVQRSHRRCLGRRLPAALCGTYAGGTPATHTNAPPRLLLVAARFCV